MGACTAISEFLKRTAYAIRVYTSYKIYYAVRDARVLKEVSIRLEIRNRCFLIFNVVRRYYILCIQRHCTDQMVGLSLGLLIILFFFFLICSPMYRLKIL